MPDNDVDKALDVDELIVQLKKFKVPVASSLTQQKLSELIEQTTRVGGLAYRYYSDKVAKNTPANKMV